MRKRTLIRMSLGLGSICMTAWQFPTLMEKFDAISGGRGIGLPAAVRASDLPPGTTVEHPVQPNEIVVYSPVGKALTPEEAEALRKKAAATAPINSVRDQPKPAPSQKPGSDVQIGAPNPAVEELLKQLQEMQKPAGGSR